MICGTVGSCVVITHWRARLREDQTLVLGLDGHTLGGFMITANIYGFDFLWGSICYGLPPRFPGLLEWENCKTSSELERARIYKVLPVKLINILYPFLYSAFVKRYYESCPEDAIGAESCLDGLKDDLIMYFVIRVCVVLAKLFGTILRCRLHMLAEVARRTAAQQLRDPGLDGRPFFCELQVVQAPAPEDPSEDFLNLLVRFALICCFAPIMPQLTVFAFVSLMLEARLLAYTAVRTAQRPMPSGAEGIGAWESVFDAVGGLSIIVIPALLTFQMHPLRDLPALTELELFLGMQYAFAGLRFAIHAFVPAVPRLVQEVYDDRDDRLVRIFSKVTLGKICLDPADLPADGLRLDVDVLRASTS